MNFDQFFTYEIANVFFQTASATQSNRMCDDHVQSVIFSDAQAHKPFFVLSSWKFRVK